MFERVAVAIDEYEAGRDALELANQLVSPHGRLLLVYVEVVMVGGRARTSSRGGGATNAGAPWNGWRRYATTQSWTPSS